jgi:pimeloyl-ACP methyl ester carboxylesterase
MGVDARLFVPQREAFPDLEVPAWLKPDGVDESLAHYAERLAASCKTTGDPTRPIVIGGLSMGGMLALEMAKHLDVKVVAMMASCDHPCAVMPLLALGDKVGRMTPRAVLSMGKVVARLFVGRGGVSPERRKLLQDMLRDMDVGFLKWAGRAVMAWGGVLGSDLPGVVIMHAHGTRDWVLPLSRLRTAPTLVVEGGAHVLSMSHAREVNEFLREAVSGASAPGDSRKR